MEKSCRRKNDFMLFYDHFNIINFCGKALKQ